MHLPYRAYCRSLQCLTHVFSRMLPWRKAEIAENLTEIPGILQALGAKRPMVVTGPTLYRTGVTGRVLEVLDAAGTAYALFFAVESDPSVTTVENIRAQYQSEGCDAFLAVGGGSPIDAAKAAAARIARPDRTIRQMAGLLRIRRRIPPFVAVPTTAGTGSETSIAAVVTDSDTHRKYAIGDLCLIPHVAVLDARLTLDLPSGITAATGMDALTHAVEAYLCVWNATRESRSMAVEAVSAIFENLESACRDGANLPARRALLWASYRAGCAFTRSGVGNVHALAHALGGLYGLPHGLLNAVLLPNVLEASLPEAERALCRLGKASGVCPSGNARAFVAEIRALARRLDIPECLPEIRAADIPELADRAYREANPTYPVPKLFDRGDFAAILRKIGEFRESDEKI